MIETRLPSVAAGGGVLADGDYPCLKALVIDTTGMEFYRDKDVDLARILAERMAEVGASGCGAYVDLLTAPGPGPAEMDALIAELTIGETYFFRHKEQFDALRELILPQVIERNRFVRRLRIWSAGCATGPEPYSVAILLEREFGAQIAGWHVTVTGTDINQKFLARAREGRYDSWAFRAVPDTLREDCFDRVGNQWQIRPQFKRHVRFQYHNLIKSPFPSVADNIAGFDVIICRNVIIYFSPATVEELVPCFYDSLTEGGWLIMGHAEPNQQLFRRFRTVNTAGAILYQKPEAAGPTTSAAAAPPPPPLSVPAVAARPSVPRMSARPARPPARPTSPPPVSLGGAASDDPLRLVRELADSGQWEAAAAACDAVIARAPLEARAHFYRALVHEQVGESEACEQALRRAIYLDRRQVLHHYHLGLFLARKDDPAGAIRSFRNAESLLVGLGDDQPAAAGEKVTVGQLREAVAMHLKLMGAL